VRVSDRYAPTVSCPGDENSKAMQREIYIYILINIYNIYVYVYLLPFY
jgi:hypothetical protein